MKDNRSIQAKIEEAMQSLDGVQRATPGPFFFTRVQAKMERPDQSQWERIVAFVTRPVVAVSVICFVLLLNATVIVNQSDSKSSSKGQQEISLADEYSLASATIYDFENQEP